MKDGKIFEVMSDSTASMELYINRNKLVVRWSPIVNKHFIVFKNNGYPLLGLY